ncbi:helix-turn-helix domain-containing protein [Pseudarcicella hirudinis]|uniref:helix-turn-helix domain-containing protein n=1 Tax=Pseudarcicella hirudinis TaxID=1079859 RepID=UPI0035EDF8C2
MFNPFVNDGVLISGGTEQSLKQVLGLIQAEESGQKDECLLSAYLKAFLIHAYRESQSSPVVGSFEDKRLKKLYELVIANFKEEKSTAFYAEKIGLTSKRLNEILKEKFNLTITKFLHNQLILEAKKEISFGEKNFKEIAFDLGFSEQAYFSRFFKKQTGLTPESFQQKMFRLSKYKS